LPFQRFALESGNMVVVVLLFVVSVDAYKYNHSSEGRLNGQEFVDIKKIIKSRII
jgi:hypothetical protein